MKNKKCTITLLLCILLPIALRGMKQTSKIFRPGTKPTAPIIRKPQPEIKLPTESPTKPQTGTIQLPQPSTSKPIQPIRPSEPIKSLEPAKRYQTFISPKDRIEHYKTLIEDAQKYNLKIKKYNNLIKHIEQAEDFTETETVNIANLFDVLQAKIELKELTITLDNLITTAKEAGISDQDLKKFKKLDINTAKDMLTIDIFKEETDKQINELENLIKEQKTKKVSEKTSKEIAIEQQIEKEILEGLQESEQEKTTKETEELQKKPARKPIRVPKEIKESPLKEFRDKEQLKLAQEAAEQKKIEEKARLKAEKDQKEINQLYKEIEKEVDAELKIEQERLEAEGQIRKIEQEQERVSASKEEQQPLINEITELEAQLGKIEKEQQKRKKKIERLQKEWQIKQTELDEQTNEEQQAHTAQQMIESNLRKNELQKIKEEAAQAKQEAVEAEKKAREQAQFEMEQLENTIKADELALQEMQKKQLELEEKLEAEKAKTEERERQKKEHEKEERERREREEREREKKEEKVEGGGDSSIPHNIQGEPSQDINKPEISQEEQGNEKPNIPISSQPQEPLLPTPEEIKPGEAALLPQNTPETTPTQPTEEPQPIMQEPIEQTIQQPTEQTQEETSPSFRGTSTGTSPRWPTSPSSSYIPSTKTTPFTPSIPSGVGMPSAAGSMGGTSLDHMNRYIQRIGLPPRPATKEEIAAYEAAQAKKIQPQDIVWWEKILPKWVVQYLGRKDRTIKETPPVETSAPIPAPEEVKTEKPKPGVVQIFIETIKKPISNAVSYIRGLFYD